ncbi:beta-galactosidase-like isoform X1 [Limulus polyphemus]|uniref:Beta-galactosidase n=1 Tax=Limulus polyphemus TaxID=6850 RepID=A0ABM1BK04_LIMPO|nr:beta-galactosidase-like isoform X1 [Limulus polyphemus]
MSHTLSLNLHNIVFLVIGLTVVKLTLLGLGFLTLVKATKLRTFTVDNQRNIFLKDGQPFRYISGSLHYFRVPNMYWKDRMKKMKAAGLNSLQTYVEWSSHEPEPGMYNFSGELDLVKFLKTAQEVGLLVIFRPGPYICAERDMGGLPYWLMREKMDIKLRTNDPTYMKFVKKWFSTLLPIINPFLYKNGGPIVTIQVENEYGQVGICDFEYMTSLRDVLHDYLGKDVILFKTDIPHVGAYKCDNIDGVLVTADFGSGTNVKKAFETIRLFRKSGPLVVTEYYPGWMGHWGEPQANVSTKMICDTLDDILSANASVNFYMFHGGTNFGFKNGANMKYAPQPTSYDYTAPISEAGDPTPRYISISKIISKYVPLPGPLPKPAPKLSIGPLTLNWISSLLDAIPFLKGPDIVYSKYPKTFEELSQAYGFMVYSTVVTFITTDPAVLNVPGLHDRGYIFVEKKFMGVLSRSERICSLPLQVKQDQILTILVENQGRINSGNILDSKGLVSNVTLGSTILTNWLIQPLPLNNTDAIRSLQLSESSDLKNALSYSTSWPQVPGFFSVNFTLPKSLKAMDTFLDPTGWRKGVVFLNGFNLGRYWPVMGPQVTLYVPGSLLHLYPNNNTLTVLELEHAPCFPCNSIYKCSISSLPSCSIKFVKIPILNGPTPYLSLNEKLHKGQYVYH